MYFSFILFILNCVFLIVENAAHKNDETYVISWNEAYSKASKLVKQMSLEQKVKIITGQGYKKTLCSGNNYAISNPYFPSLCYQDGPLGVQSADNITAGVTGINAAASFDKDAMYSRGKYMGEEFRNKGINVFLGPSMNFMRCPEGGRIWESFGEDPFLSGVAASETIKGVQSNGVIAVAKHFILNEQEKNRNSSSSNIDERTLREIYLWPFSRSVEAEVGSIMCGYNEINGIRSCENDYLLNTILKGELGFRGFITSDWFATTSTVPSSLNGLDVEMPGNIANSTEGHFGKKLVNAVGNDLISMDRITDMATRVTAAWYKMGQDVGFPETKINTFNRSEAPFVNVQKNHKELVRSMGAASLVLLKNSGILPLSTDVPKKISFIGSDAGPSKFPLNECGGIKDCHSGTLAQGWGSGTADFPYLIDPLSGFFNATSDIFDISSCLDDYNLTDAGLKAREADIAFVFALSDSGEALFSEGDRANLSLWYNGDDLIRTVADNNENTIVVIHSVGPVLMPWINHPNIKAILWPGLPGQESGNAFTDIVLGRVNPSGRLPYTIAENYDDYPVHCSSDLNINYNERLLLGYKYFDFMNIKPLFPFGHGLSYTRFTYSKLKVKVSNTRREKNDFVYASFNLKNSGNFDGAEIAQAYIGFPDHVDEPPKLLRGFEKIYLKVGEQKKVDFKFNKLELSVWNATVGSWRVPYGDFTLYVGASSRDIRQSAIFNIRSPISLNILIIFKNLLLEIN